MYKKHCVFGIFAHVDAGKTTFTEQLLYQAGILRSPGRVDEGTSVMDTEEVEKRRGITVFADQGYFQYGDHEYAIMDTPGHVDFAAEAERVMQVLDYAVLLLSGTEGVEAHTATLFRLLQAYRIPVLFFINKMDQEHADLSYCLEDIKQKLTGEIWYFGENQIQESGKKQEHPLGEAGIPTVIQAFQRAAETDKEEALLEFLAERDEDFLEEYLSWEEGCKTLRNGCPFGNRAWERFRNAVRKRTCFPVFSGSARNGKGISSFLENMDALMAESGREIGNDEGEKAVWEGVVYKVRHDDKAGRLVFLKIVQGILHIRDELEFCNGKGECTSEKVNEIRLYQGSRYRTVNELYPGQVAAVVGLKFPRCGDRIFSGHVNQHHVGSSHLQPVLRSKVFDREQKDIRRLYEALRRMEEEEPALSVNWQENINMLTVHVMGNIQLEVLEFLLQERFGIPAGFDKPQVEYRETIQKPVIGYGHFEPLRHYAEVKLRLEPMERGSGISFASECHVDVLSRNYQKLVETHVFEREHKGILTGSAITDIRVVLLSGRSHIKHTEGGDFREAVYRAIRQGLEKADNLLLEPMYRLEIYADLEHTGRLMADIQKCRGHFEAPEVLGSGDLACIKGRVPAAEFMDYPAEFASYTKGRGSLAMTFDGYDICSNAGEVIEQIGYQKERDLEHTSTSVFCAKGAAFTVQWDEAETYMHCRD